MTASVLGEPSKVIEKRSGIGHYGLSSPLIGHGYGLGHGYSLGHGIGHAIGGHAIGGHALGAISAGPAFGYAGPGIGYGGPAIGLSSGAIGLHSGAIIGADVHTTVTKHVGVPVPAPYPVPVDRPYPVPVKVSNCSKAINLHKLYHGVKKKPSKSPTP